MMKEGKKKRILNDSGTTLIETLAAFTVLTAILVILYNIVDFSSNLRTQAVDSAHLNQMFFKEMYKNESAVSGDDPFINITDYQYNVADGDISDSLKQCRFWLELDPEKTNMESYTGEQFNDYIPGTNDYFYLNNTAATVYICVDPLIDEENLPRPAAMKYHYLSPEERLLP